jgi:hypothetical protein
MNVLLTSFRAFYRAQRGIEWKKLGFMVYTLARDALRSLADCGLVLCARF